MNYLNYFTFCVTGILLHVGFSHGQGTNLLQRYIKQYFQDYFPSTVRSYTLYGNGQQGAADFHAGLPFPYQKDGKVKSLIYSTASNPPPLPPKVSSKSSGGIVETHWMYPGPPQSNSFYPGPNQRASIYHVESVPDLQQQNHPAPVYTPMDATANQYQNPNPIDLEPVAESRMVVLQQAPVRYYETDNNFNREISLQSSMTF